MDHYLIFDHFISELILFPIII